MAQQVGEEVAVRDFHIDVPQEELDDLRQRILASSNPKRSCMEPNRSLLARPQVCLRVIGH